MSQVVAQIITAYQTNGGDLTKAFAPFAAAQKKPWWTLAIPADLPHDERQQWADGKKLSLLFASFSFELVSSARTAWIDQRVARDSPSRHCSNRSSVTNPLSCAEERNFSPPRLFV